MSNSHNLLCLSVEEFFNCYNWQGQKQVEKKTSVFSNSISYPTIWQCLTVQDFFRLCNWHSIPLENPKQEYIEPSSCLSLKVEDFFQMISWESTPKIGSLPQQASMLQSPPIEVEETTFTDLTDLF